MNRDSLYYFHQLCSLGSFAAAAASIPMTVQGLRKTVHALEAELGVKLCVSTRDGVEPTEAGRLLDAFHNEVSPIYARLEHDLSLLRAQKAKPLRVGFSFGLFGLAYQAMLGLPREHPDWEVDYASLPESSLVRDMEAGLFDLALTWGAPESEALAYEHVADIGVFAVARRDNPLVMGGAPICVADFEGADLVSIGDLHKPHQLFMRACAANDVRLRRVYEASEMPVTQAYLRQGLGVGLALAQEHATYGTELFSFARIRDFSLPVGISHRVGRPLQGRAHELADLLADQLAKNA